MISKQIKRLLLLLSAPLLLTSCELAEPDDDAARDAAVRWADAYFNCDFHEAAEYATDESLPWLRFAASNTTEHDLQALQDEGGARVSADEGVLAANDTLRVIRLTVNHFLAPVAIGQEPHLADEALFEVTLVLRDNHWKVRMEGLPRSERQSRD